MQFLKTIGWTTLCLMITLAFNADPAFSKPKHKSGKHHGKKHEKIHKKHEKEHEKHDDSHGNGRHSRGHGDDCDFYPPGLAKQGKVPYGLAKQGKVPPGWSKKCRRDHDDDQHHHAVHAHDRKHQDSGFHIPEKDRRHSPCKNTVLNGKAKDVAVGTAMGAGIGGIVGSGTGDTEAGAIFGGVVGGIIGAAAGDGDKQASVNLPDC